MYAGLIPNQVLVTAQVQSGKQRLAFVLIMNYNLSLSFCLYELASVKIAYICFISGESFTLVKCFAPEYSALLQVAEIFTFKRFISNFFIYVYNRFVVSIYCVILLPEQISFHMCSLLFCCSDIHTP